MEIIRVSKDFTTYSGRGIADLGDFKYDKETFDEIRVGWQSVGILRRGAPQKRLLTRGLGSCYATLGENIYGDKILGHFYSGTTKGEENEILRKKLRLLFPWEKRYLEDFDISYVYGENGVREKSYVYHVDVTFDREKNLWLVEKTISTNVSFSD